MSDGSVIAAGPAAVGRAPGRGGATAVALLDADAARAGDLAAITAGDPRAVLMARAAGHLARAVVGAAGRGYGLDVTVVVGRGDNGGDGWAAAPLLVALGARVTVVAPDGTDAPTGPEAAAHRTAWLAAGGRVVTELGARAARTDVVVDAVLGTGASGPLRGGAALGAAAVARAREAGALVVACDLPTGVDADDGSVVDGAVVADVTVTLGGVKRGLVLHPGAAHAGTVVVGGLGARYRPPDAGWAALTPIGACPSARPVDDEKRRRGSLLVVAGAVGTSGAASLVARGAEAAGVGLITVAVPDPVRAEVAGRAAGPMVLGLPVDARGEPAEDAAHALPDPAAHRVVVAGPGLGVSAGAGRLVAHLRRRAQRLVLDADALNLHRDDPAALADHAGALVLTPHARELARLGGGSDAEDAWRHRAVRAPRLAAELGATLLVKGPGTIVAAPDGRVWVTPLGTPALATGGTGDVLAGVVAAAVAAANDVPLAVARAAWWHAAAGELAAVGRGGAVAATDVADAVPSVLGLLARWVPAEPPCALGRAAPDAARFRAALVEVAAVDGAARRGPGGRR